MANLRTTAHKYDIATTDYDDIMDQTRDLTVSINSREIYNVTSNSFDADVQFIYEEEPTTITFTRYPAGDVFMDQVGPDSDE